MLKSELDQTPPTAREKVLRTGRPAMAVTGTGSKRASSAGSDLSRVSLLLRVISLFLLYPVEMSNRAYTRNTFIASSPRWLMTLTAMRPEGGAGNGRDVSLFSVAQASGSISAFSVVLSAL